MLMHDSDLVERLRSGDGYAFRGIVDQYQSAILNCCYRFVNDRATAEDLTQDVFIEVFRSIGQFRGESKFSTWLLRIAITKSLDHLKHLGRKKRFAFLRSLSADEAEVTPASDLPDPHEVLEQQERRRVLSEAIGSLAENQRVAFTLSTDEELSYKEIAEILNTTVPAVESLIFRARTNLKKKLYRYYKQHE